MIAIVFLLLLLFQSHAWSFPKKCSSVLLTVRRDVNLKLRMSSGLERPPDHKLFYSQKRLEDLGLSSTMVELAHSLGIQKPSKIQAISSFGISTGKPCIIADQTGSGKTLAYLFPTLQRMIDERKIETTTQHSNNSPFMVIMTPTAELAM